ncbi:unnamed protein product [Linum trigynum]|uniref:Uncharacterized protein n=1 Tax=Linum trigynum TaxID=586398 RepID=A0AAV2D821_9ROSI
MSLVKTEQTRGAPLPSPLAPITSSVRVPRHHHLSPLPSAASRRNPCHHSTLVDLGSSCWRALAPANPATSPWVSMNP